MRFITVFSAICWSVATAFSGNVTGKVVDENNAPMEFVNVVLMSRSDSTFIEGVVTGADGMFVLENRAAKPAFVRITAIGHDSTDCEIPESGNLGTVVMSPAGIELGEVVVKANRRVTAVRGNALVTDVENSRLSQAGTAGDVLRNVPMVTGSNGNFEVFGKGAPLIYVNGRRLHDTGELARISSADVKSVEVITSPGAKYDASVNAVIRIRLKRPQGDGFSGTLRAQNGFRHNFFTYDQANLKFRTRGLELFADLGYYDGKSYIHKFNDMTTESSVVWRQNVETLCHVVSRELTAKAGFSYMINERHSFGAYYQNGLNKSDADYNYFTDAFLDGKPYDKIYSEGHDTDKSMPKHYTNAYYNGSVGNLGIDLNVDYMWRKDRTTLAVGENSGNFDDSSVRSCGLGHSRMFAERLSLSYPVWKGAVEIGEEYISSRVTNDFATNAASVNDATSQVDEKNIAGYVQLMQQFGRFNVVAGLRYEHVSFDYIGGGQQKTCQGKTYNNLFPSLSVSTEIDNVSLALSYSNKTRRPTYEALNGTVSYINRYILESGNPYLQPTVINSVELIGGWRQFFGQVAYSYKKDPILNTSMPYGEDGAVKLLTKENYPEIHELQAFLGGRFQLGIWQPVINAGIISQWLTIDYGSGRKDFNQPIVLLQWQNAVHLPGDVWLNVDMQWMSAGNGENAYAKASSFLNAKLYKAFFNNSFSVTLEANDIFNKNNRDFIFYNKDVTLDQRNRSDNRAFMITLQYRFNVTRDRYKGCGAGTEELSRF